MAVTPEAFGSLLARARQGDRDALAELVQQYEADVRLVARLRLGPALRPYLDSVDLVQSVHHSLLLGLQQQKFDISTPEELVALALTLVRRKAAKHWRHLQRQQRLSGGTTERPNLPDLLASLASPQADPAQAAQYRDTIAHVCGQLNTLERQLLELHLQGYRTVEIAHALGQDADALRVRLSRLRQRLRASGILSEGL